MDFHENHVNLNYAFISLGGVEHISMPKHIRHAFHRVGFSRSSSHHPAHHGSLFHTAKVESIHSSCSIGKTLCVFDGTRSGRCQRCCCCSSSVNGNIIVVANCIAASKQIVKLIVAPIECEMFSFNFVCLGGWMGRTPHIRTIRLVSFRSKSE